MGNFWRGTEGINFICKQLYEIDPSTLYTDAQILGLSQTLNEVNCTDVVNDLTVNVYSKENVYE